MALEIKITTDFGIDATYHKLVAIEYDYTAKTGSAKLHGYVDAAARKADAEPITQSIVQLIDADEFDIVACYQVAKADERFKKAKDV